MACSINVAGRTGEVLTFLVVRYSYVRAGLSRREASRIVNGREMFVVAVVVVVVVVIVVVAVVVADDAVVVVVSKVAYKRFSLVPRFVVY